MSEVKSIIVYNTNDLNLTLKAFNMQNFDILDIVVGKNGSKEVYKIVYCVPEDS